jgi:hypothetical protein
LEIADSPEPPEGGTPYLGGAEVADSRIVNKRWTTFSEEKNWLDGICPTNCESVEGVKNEKQKFGKQKAEIGDRKSEGECLRLSGGLGMMGGRKQMLKTETLKS